MPHPQCWIPSTSAAYAHYAICRGSYLHPRMHAPLHRLSPDAEVTVEANPGTVDREKLSQLREAGFNRLSLGVQSLDDEFLRRIGRAHTRDQATEAYSSARAAGFANVGIDLIYALPGQSVEHWSRTWTRRSSSRPSISRSTSYR